MYAQYPNTLYSPVFWQVLDVRPTFVGYGLNGGRVYGTFNNKQIETITQPFDLLKECVSKISCPIGKCLLVIIDKACIMLLYFVYSNYLLIGLNWYLCSWVPNKYLK